MPEVQDDPLQEPQHEAHGQRVRPQPLRELRRPPLRQRYNSYTMFFARITETDSIQVYNKPQAVRTVGTDSKAFNSLTG